VTIATLAEGDTFESQLVEDEHHMLWLHRTNTRGQRMGFRVLLSAALTLGWRIVRASPEEQVLLDAHGFGSRRIQ
jgi:hypothetical protein